MTVRAWLTISAFALAALGIAFGIRFVSPVKAPKILATAGKQRLHGDYRGSCWPQPRGGLRCEADPRPRPRNGAPIARTGRLRIVADFPVQPTEGKLVVRGSATEPIVEAPWNDTLPYDLPPGGYVLRAEARYPKGGYVRYDFAFKVRP